MGVAVADGAEVAVGVEVAPEPQPAAARPRTRSREIHPALLINEAHSKYLLKTAIPKAYEGMPLLDWSIGIGF